ncbi:RmlC-like cupin [Neoconidiobolus thromboides FSU 785]|nr:RmlC-like cupin [Neoconidiobolus thromboides FSU 785]
MVNIKIRESESRGYVDKGWLKASHSFSFSTYVDEEYMGYGLLRVLNEDHVEKSSGFGFHSHRNYEIITYIVSGEIEHKDNMGHREIIKRGQIQFTSAGSGISHSEVNSNKELDAHVLQVWVKPNAMNLTPYYDTLKFEEKKRSNQFIALISPGDYDSSEITDTIGINANFYMSSILLDGGNRVEYNYLAKLNANRKIYIHVVDDSTNSEYSLLNEEFKLFNGDAAIIEDFNEVDKIELENKGEKRMEIVIFEMY